MRINDVILEKATATKPRNFVAKNAMKTTSGAGKHKDKKKAQKQGYEKHKSKSVSESLRPGEYHVATVTLDDGTVKKVKVFSDEGFRDRIQQTFAKQGQRVKDIKMDYGVYGESIDEGIGGTIAGGIGQFLGNKIDPVHGEIMRLHGEAAGRKAEYTIRKYIHLLQKALKQQLSSGTGNEDMEEAQDDWGSMSHREFKSKELQHELGHEDDPEFQRMMRERDRGPWYIKISGKIYKQKGQPKVFDQKKGANNYALAMVKNRPELRGNIVLTRKPIDEVTETATAGATSAGNVAVGAVYKNKKGRTYKNPDGTAKNALDVKGANLLTGGSVAKR